MHCILFKKSLYLQLRFAATYGITTERQRFWIWIARSNGSYRPERTLTREEELKRRRSQVAAFFFFCVVSSLFFSLAVVELRYTNFFLEIVKQNPPRPMPPEHRLVFFKTFNPKTSTLSYESSTPIDIISIDNLISLSWCFSSPPLSYLGYGYVLDTYQVSDLDVIVGRSVPSRVGAKPLYFEGWL